MKKETIESWEEKAKFLYFLCEVVDHIYGHLYSATEHLEAIRFGQHNLEA